MRKMVHIVVVNILVLLLPLSIVLGADLAPLEERVEYVPGEIIIGFDPDATTAQINAAVASIGGEVIGSIDLPQGKIRKVRISATGRLEMDAAITDIRNSPLILETIKYVEPNLIGVLHQAREPGGGEEGGIMSQSSDPYLSEQWGYYDIGANWISAQTAPAPAVAVIDTGVDYTHPDLAGKVLSGYDFVNADADPMDDYGHGTHVSGIIAAKANNLFGIAGVSWNSKILPVKVCNRYGSCPLFETVLGIQYAADNSAVKVINMSLGFGYSPTLQDAVEYAVVTKKKLLVASAGNGNSNTPQYPAGFSTTFPDRVLAVAAHGIDQCKASFSNYGSWVSITAPGVDILSTVPSVLYGVDFAEFDGTSMAAPHVSGAAAVAWGKYPTYNNAQIGTLIKNNSSLPFDPLVRDGTCWPNDLTTFARADIFHVISPAAYEDCTYWEIVGHAMDAPSGEPLLGAQAKLVAGTKVGIDYVPYYGYRTNPLNENISVEGFGLFAIPMTSSFTPPLSTKLYLSKPRYPKVTINTTLTPMTCGYNQIGIIPVPTKTPYYWLAVTWNYGDPSLWYDPYLYVPGYAVPYYWNNMGGLNEAPWVKYFYDGIGESGLSLRGSSGVFRIKKLVPGTYTFRVLDLVHGAGSTYWSASGIKAYIYRWDATLAQPKLVATFTPPSGAGAWWDVCTITGKVITPVNTLGD